MSQDTKDTIIADVVFVVVVYIAAEVAFKAVRTVKKRRANKRIIRKMVVGPVKNKHSIKVGKTKVL